MENPEMKTVAIVISSHDTPKTPRKHPDSNDDSNTATMSHSNPAQSQPLPNAGGFVTGTTHTEAKPVTMKKAWQNTKDRSDDLRATIISLLDTVDDIVKEALANADNPNLIYDSAKRQVSKENNILQKYHEILSAFEKGVPTEPENGERREDNAYIFDCLMKLAVEEINKCVREVMQTIENSTRAHEKLEDEHRMLNEQIAKMEQDVKYAQKMKNQALADKNIIKGTNLKLQEQLDEKSNSILDLNRDKNVIAWQKEKQLWADGQGSKEYELEKKLRIQEDEFTISRHKLTTRIAELQDQVKKLKTEKSHHALTPRVSRRKTDFDAGPTAEEELEGMRKQLFHSERLLILEKSEVNKQRRFYAGLMTGVQKEWTMMMARADVFEKNYSLEQKTFADRMKMIIEATENGRIVQLRSEPSLPLYYKGMDVRLSDDVIQKCKSKYTARLENDSAAVLGLKEVHVNPKTVSWRLGDEAPSPNLYEEMKDLRSHPKLEDANGNLREELAVEHFKHFGSERVLALHAIFKSIDTNKNHVLDTNELMEHLSLPSGVNRKCSREEVSEALMEIDADESGSLDFYEFLLLLTKLERGELKSKLFNTKAFGAIPAEVKELKKSGSVKKTNGAAVKDESNDRPSTAESQTKVCVVQ